MQIFTIGFTKKSAQEFFTALTNSGVKSLIDVRLNNTSQLAGFAKRDDLRYFLSAIGNIGYLHLPELAPTQGMLDAYKNQKSSDWAAYETQFRALLTERNIPATLDPALFDRACLLCSEAKPDRCHRRIVAEHLRDSWSDVEITHL